MALPRPAEHPEAITAELREIAARAQPPAPAEQRLIPVLPPLGPLFPGGGLRRGSVVTVTGSTSLALAVVAGASQAGSWCAAVGLPSLGLAAAAELGIALDRFPLVAWPSHRWAWTVASLLDGFDVVLACPPSARRSGSLGTSDSRRLAARARERGSALVVTGDWSGRADVGLAVTSATWEGIGNGHGRLRARRVEVLASGRGAAATPRRAALWLPGHDGGVATAPVSPSGAVRVG